MNWLRLTPATIESFPALAQHRDEIEPCVIRREGDIVYLDADGECWKRLKREYVAIIRPTEQQQAEPKDGPGTELHEILEALGISMKKDCGCDWKLKKMNRWGVAGAMANRETIIAWMREGQENYGWKDRAIAAFNAIKSGLVLEFNPVDPLPGLVDLAIRRAANNEA